MLEKLSMQMAKLSEQRHLRAIRDGIIATLPLIIVGSIFLIVAFPPFPVDWGISLWAKKNIAQILLPYRMTMFIMALYAVMGIGNSLAKSYKLDGITGAILATSGFLLTIVPTIVKEILVVTQVIDGKEVQIIAEKGTEGATVLQEAAGFVMPMTNLGSAGLFVGIIIAIFAVEVYRFTTTTGFRIKMPDSVPASVARSFEALTPTLIVVLVVATVTYWLHINLHGIMKIIIEPLVKATDSWFSVIIIVFLITFFWSFGIHGVSIVGSLVRPLWLTLLDQNTAALADGKVIPHIAAEPFYQWFIWIGGSGATIGLAILLATVSKSSYGKTLGRTSIVSSIFNINEPIIFGAPIVLNPILIPPFIIVPVVNSSIAYLCTSMGLVNKVTSTPPWTLPGPIGSFLATNGDYRAAILNIVLIISSAVIYYPFFKAYDKKLLEDEKNGEAE
ncbi:PTS sugar transporter subunit IIC [Pseudoleptotrichia goodfellowii]|uniref:Permease IIC component n=1 Tax=Pseudoleptotrichia goodfellowii F0264 TaxID=596323 RepID=D0GMN9_9FUSO|nr:PTS sugar transporter subunit IIC [Pseudoleptotrichia goodfellowii]EEY34632.1 putative PTS system, cellobiose-specific IIC component [Pseudoleptotrichia goodfellowii F0264]